jgi:hypothetical protein
MTNKNMGSSKNVNSTVHEIYDQQYTDYQIKRSWLRKMVRRWYLNHTLKYVRGKAIDFGCGIGELLSKLPKGSIGFEVNIASIAYCKESGLDVRHYQPDVDNYQLKDCKPGEYQTLIISHVLEHLETPHIILHLLLESCNRLDIERIIFIVPGIKGFLSDQTHKTFIDIPYIKKHHLSDIDGYDIIGTRYFPLNVSWIGKYFTHHELMVIYESNK